VAAGLVVQCIAMLVVMAVLFLDARAREHAARRRDEMTQRLMVDWAARVC
jgi:hypothetical protein